MAKKDSKAKLGIMGSTFVCSLSFGITSVPRLSFNIFSSRFARSTNCFPVITFLMKKIVMATKSASIPETLTFKVKAKSGQITDMNLLLRFPG